VGASLLAMDVNDDAFFLNAHVVLRFFASRLAPTKDHALIRTVFFDETEPCITTIKS
jgi:hypothetical protein